MNSKIINPSQYKKITKEKNIKRTEQIDNKIKKGKIKEINVITSSDNSNKNYSIKKRIIIGIILVGIMAFLSTISVSFFNVDKIEYIATINNKEETIVNNDFELKVGVLNLDLSRNVLINELKKEAFSQILNFDDKYNINLQLSQSIEKNDSKTYTITFKEKNINQIVKEAILDISKNQQNIYYTPISNISKVELDGEYNLKINLKEENDYFIYYLDFPIEKNENNNSLYNYNENSENKVAVFNRNQEISSYLKSIEIKNYSDSLNMIDDFKKGNINMFLTNSDDDIKSLNRYDYNLKKYRDGETVFLLGNPKSKLFKEEEVRKAIAYSIDRNELVKDISLSYAELIDIPYINSKLSYRYDTYAVDSLLSSNKWVYKNGIYTKNIDNKNIMSLKIRLLVNSDDSSKVTLANNIKIMLENNKIPVEIIKVPNSQISEYLKGDKYDFVLAKVSLNNVPDISKIYNYINIDEKTNELINNIKNSNTLTIAGSINDLKEYISSHVLCIGIYAKNVDVITQKNIKGFENIQFMNIFSALESISK